MGVACSAAQPSQAVWVYVPLCAGVSPSAPPSSASATYFGTGDFLPLPDSESKAALNATGPALGLPASTESVEINVTAGSVVWGGVSLVPASGQVSLLTLPILPVPSACQFTDSSGSGRGVVDSPVSGSSAGLIDPQHALIVGGQSAFVLDLGKGTINLPAPALSAARDFASITPFESGALVAGGRNSFTTLQTTERYSPAPNGEIGGFSEGPDLVYGREMHGAIALPTGETLLIGGVGGPSNEPLQSLEIVAMGKLLPISLHQARVNPTVLRLPTGQIFVGGGLDGLGGRALSTGEWLDGNLDALKAGSKSSPLVSSSLCDPESATPPSWSFAPLEGGAVLAVSYEVPPKGMPGSCLSNVFVIRPGSAEPAPLLDPAPQPLSPMLLFAGARSMPLMVTEDSASRWDPWQDEFVASPACGTSGAIQLPTGTVPTTTLLAADPGLALWLGSDTAIYAARFDTRNIYSNDSQTLLAGACDMAPDRLVFPSGSDVTFEPGIGLTLQNGASAFLTDATFADVSVRFTSTFTADSSLTVLFRDNDTGTKFSVDLAPCIDPQVKQFPQDTTFLVERRGSLVTAGLVQDSTADAGAAVLSTCSVFGLQAGARVALEAGERVAVGFLGPSSGLAKVSAVTVKRLGSP
jgi:hypothetical protein